MKIPRDMGGQDLAGTLCRLWGLRVVHQRGSHIVIETEEPSHHRVAIPAHKSLRVGTLNAILRGVPGHNGVDRQEILRSL
jgi:predicted RNA binding protein YcfA (HicA-like mRNA interferase family)